MRVTVKVDVAQSQMVVQFPDCVLRFAIAPIIKGISEILSYKDGFVVFKPLGTNGESYIDLREVCSWVKYNPNLSDIQLEVVR